MNEPRELLGTVGAWIGVGLIFAIFAAMIYMSALNHVPM